MSLEELYHWQRVVRRAFGFLGCWQVLGLALYSYGVVLARHCAPSRVSEKLGLVGKADTVQRRLERFLHNGRIAWQRGCQAWSGWVLSHYRGDRGCCSPLAFWCYRPQQWPMKQVVVIETLLSWIAPSVPLGIIPLVQAD